MLILHNIEDHMSQNPSLPEENIENVKKPARRGRKSKIAENAAPEAGEAAPQDGEASAEGTEKKPARRTRKPKAEAPAEAAQNAEQAVAGPSAEEKPRRGRKPKTAAPSEEAVPAQEAKAGKPRRGRKPKAEAEEKPAEAQPEQDSKEARKTVRRGRKAAPEQAEAAPLSAEAPAEADPEVQPENTEKPRRGRKPQKGGKRPEAEELGTPDYDSAREDEQALQPAAQPEDAAPAAPFEEKGGKARGNRHERQPRHERRNRKAAEPGNQAEDKARPVDDDFGNRAEAQPAPAADAQPEWFDDGIVTNILPYPGEFGDDLRSHRRTRKNRRDRDAQPAFNGSPYLPAPYQQDFYGHPQALMGEPAFGNRKDRRGKKNRRNQGQVPQLPADFDFNAAMLNDSVLGTVLAPREEEFLPEDDGPQPVLNDQPAALPLSSGDMTDEDLEALDAAVNGNRIDAPARPQQKDERKNKKGKKAKDEKPAREEKKAKAKEEAPAADAAPKAKRVLYISVVPDEQVEVVITEDGLVTEYFVEMAHQVKIRGNIYKGVINNIDTNLQAAFVNFGNGKNGFLQIDEVHPEYYLVPHDATRGPKYPPIQKVLKVGQEVLVQVVKEPAGTKGAFLTTWISIAGRFLVLTPGQEQIGVSRKVEDPEERARLKELLNDIQPGENMGVIIRTASEGVNKDSIQQDLQFLKKLWKDIQKKAPVEKCPSLIYQEADLATRSVRDYLSDDIEEIWIDDESTKARVEEIVGVIFPERAGSLVKIHKEQRQTLWERFNLLKQLETVTSREVVLPSGGRLVFDQTEALMAIDINSGKTQGKTNFEAMVFRTNMEAAEAIARHLRLRDIGGQVVIDFIEMRDKNHCREVERTIRNAMRRDRARHDVGHMSSFGLLELVRQRTGTSAISITTEPCPHCHGTGVRRNMEWQAQQAMRDLQTKLCKSLDNAKHKKGDQKNEKAELATFVYESDAELALYILNRKRDRIAALEEKFGVHIEVRLKP